MFRKSRENQGVSQLEKIKSKSRGQQNQGVSQLDILDFCKQLNIATPF
ncbi:MAG: hypothetical protein Q9M50_13555 [Methylococcales bacterium]|nr:hypothetical protein [Methylococcales bacterium]